MLLRQVYLKNKNIGDPISFSELMRLGVDVDADMKVLIETYSKYDYTISKLPNWSYDGYCVEIEGNKYSHISLER